MSRAFKEQPISSGTFDCSFGQAIYEISIKQNIEEYPNPSKYLKTSIINEPLYIHYEGGDLKRDWEPYSDWE